MNLDDIMLNKINQSQKTNAMRFCLYETPRGVKFIETERRMVAARSWGRRGGGGVLNGYRAAVVRGV